VAVVGAGHERVVLRLVGEHHQLGTGQAVAVGRAGRHLLEQEADAADDVHVDPGLGRGHVERGAHLAGGQQGARHGLDERGVGVGGALFDLGGVAAGKVDVDVLGRRVQGLRELDKAVRVAPRADVGQGADRQAFVDDRHTVAGADLVADPDQGAGDTADLVAQACAERADLVVPAVAQVQPEGDGAHVQVLVLDHGDRLEDLVGSDHAITVPGSDARPGGGPRPRPPRRFHAQGVSGL